MTFSPARAHKNKLLAEAAAKQIAEDDTPKSSEYEVMLANMDQQRRSLKQIQSKATKIAMKGEYLANDWQPYIDATLAENSGAHDSLISRLWVWLIDTSDFAQAIALGRYMLEHDLKPPEDFARTTACVFAEQLAEAWLIAPDKSKTITSDELAEVLELVAGHDPHDMPDEVSAKLQRAFGESLQDSDIESAIAHLSRAIELNQNVGCKQLLATLNKKLENQVEGDETADDK